MGTASIPTLQVQSTLIGTSPIDNPSTLALKIGGVIYGDAYDIVENNYTRRIFPVYESSTNSIYLKSIDYAHGSDMPSTTLDNVEILVIA